MNQKTPVQQSGEPQSELFVSLCIASIMLPYLSPYIAPFKEFRPIAQVEKEVFEEDKMETLGGPAVDRAGAEADLESRHPTIPHYTPLYPFLGLGFRV